MLSYDELRLECEQLLQENKRLKTRIVELIAENYVISGSNDEVVLNENVASPVNMRSSPEEKILLFRSLFQGRDDVFARRWQSATSGKSGYQPVCGNEWEDGLCDKKKYKCAVCPNRKLLPLSDADIFKHLSGKDLYARDVIGLYPMLADETCNFICADFDDEHYKEDVAAFREVCKQQSIPIAIERSRSGNGAHAWLFFSEPVPTSDARKLCSGILTLAMEKRGELSFKSYDRLLPNQDTMPEGGFGNLIALPLQGLARKSGNSLFVDENFNACPDQWEYLGSIEKLDKSSVEGILSTLCGYSELGVLVSDSEEKPWDVKKPSVISAADFPESLCITEANMLYIPTASLSPAAKNAVKRLAAFRNPDFFRAQAMRLPIYNKPRIICTAELTEQYIGIPRGCKEALLALLDKHNVPYQLDDKTNCGTPIPVTFNGSLREEQQPAVEALLAQKNGVLSATTAFGKTVVAAYLISKRKINTLILVHTAALMEQWKKSIEQFLSFDITPPEAPKGRGRKKPWSPVGQLGSTKNTLHGMVDVAVMQSLSDGNGVKELVRNYGMIIVDECHHVSAVNFERILSFADAEFVYGLTATPTRQDGQHPIIFMQCGAICYKVDAKTQADKSTFEHYLIPRFTTFRNPCAGEKSITAIFKQLSESEVRNELIIADVIKTLGDGRNPIVLTERREHALLLTNELNGKCKNIVTLIGTTSSRERRESMERLCAIPGGEPLVIVATGKYVGEGFDFPRLDTLFLAMPIAWKGKVAQYAGRLHRNYPGKTEVQIFDYADIHIPVLERMYQKRVKSYAAIGYKIKPQSDTATAPDVIYDGKSFYPVFAKDIENARREILIVSPFMRKSRLTQMINLLKPLIISGISVTVVTRPPENFKESDSITVHTNAEYLAQHGIHVQFKPDFHQKFAVIDQKTVWYGSVNFLSFGSHEESIMRFESRDIAGQLLDSVL